MFLLWQQPTSWSLFILVYFFSIIIYRINNIKAQQNIYRHTHKQETTCTFMKTLSYFLSELVFVKNFCVSSILFGNRYIYICSVQFSHSVVSDSLRPHESQHARPPCPSPTPRVHSNSRLGHLVSERRFSRIDANSYFWKQPVVC